MGCFEPAAGLDSADGCQNFRGIQIDNGLATYPRENIPLEALDDLVGVARGPGGQHFAVPLAGHGFEAVGHGIGASVLVGLLVLAGVDTVRDGLRRGVRGPS